MIVVRGFWLSPLVVLAVAASACGASATSSRPAVIVAGQVPPSAVLVGGAGGTAAAGSTGTTIPLAKQDPTTALFSRNRDVSIVPERVRGYFCRGAQCEQSELALQQSVVHKEPDHLCRPEQHRPSLERRKDGAGQSHAETGSQREQDLSQVAHLHDRTGLGCAGAETRCQRCPLLIWCRRWRGAPANATARSEPSLEPRHTGVRCAGAKGQDAVKPRVG